MNPSKYKGDPTNIVYRSRWEFIVMQQFDSHPDVLQWSSEEIRIPYVCPTDGKKHTYYPDFWMQRKSLEGKIEEFLIEVKPFKETIPPKVQTGKSNNRRYITEVMKWGKNSAKWKAAEALCMQKNWTFMKITEKELGLNF